MGDLDAVNAAFVGPLYYLGNLWFYSWSAPTEIKADDLLIALGMENYLGLPRDIGGRYIDRAGPAQLDGGRIRFCSYTLYGDLSPHNDL